MARTSYREGGPFASRDAVTLTAYAEPMQSATSIFDEHHPHTSLPYHLLVAGLAKSLRDLQAAQTAFHNASDVADHFHTHPASESHVERLHEDFHAAEAVRDDYAHELAHRLAHIPIAELDAEVLGWLLDGTIDHQAILELHMSELAREHHPAIVSAIIGQFSNDKDDVLTAVVPVVDLDGLHSLLVNDLGDALQDFCIEHQARANATVMFQSQAWFDHRQLERYVVVSLLDDMPFSPYQAVCLWDVISDVAHAILPRPDGAPDDQPAQWRAGPLADVIEAVRTAAAVHRGLA